MRDKMKVQFNFHEGPLSDKQGKPSRIIKKSSDTQLCKLIKERPL